MAAYDAYLIDLDGTIYHGSRPIPAAKIFIERLQQAGIPYLFVTNNSTKTPAAVAQTLTEQHDIKTTPDQVYTSALATADYLRQQSDQPNPKQVYLIGEAGLRAACDQAEIELVPAEAADYVVLGLDRAFDYEKLKAATQAIARGARFIATNADTKLPSEDGMLPGAGSLVAAVATATGVQPTIIAKPEAPIISGALARLGQPKRPIMVGDNYHTDILAGINNGLATLLVYTGVARKEQVAEEDAQPSHSVDALDEWDPSK
ncbi:TIGR01457 family HAD-type hydrolase [Leuconostocaceae bacterium ESL0958]|nr:TIGR01457 family HAD-type hydrolase [Leuconostocaceae bacterium ESL0958]